MRHGILRRVVPVMALMGLMQQPLGRMNAAAPAAAPVKAVPAAHVASVVTATETVTKAMAAWPGIDYIFVCATNPQTVEYAIWGGKYRTYFESSNSVYYDWGPAGDNSCSEGNHGKTQIPYVPYADLTGQSLALMYPSGLVTVTEAITFPSSSPRSSVYDTWLSDGKWRVFDMYGLGESSQIEVNGAALLSAG